MSGFMYGEPCGEAARGGRCLLTLGHGGPHSSRGHRTPETRLVEHLFSERDLPTGRQRGLTCPDGGTCHHACQSDGRCFRADTCEPLSGEWPEPPTPEALR